MKIICIGDSLTYGLGVPVENSWVEILNRETEYIVKNKGINGDTSGGMLARLERDVLSQDADIVFIMGGANDFIMGCDECVVQANLMALVHHVYAAKKKVVLGIEIESIAEDIRADWKMLTDFDKVNEKIKSMAMWLPRFCKTFQIPYIDLYNEFHQAVRDHEKEYYLDGVHPNIKGHRLIADIIKSHI